LAVEPKKPFVEANDVAYSKDVLNPFSMIDGILLKFNACFKLSSILFLISIYLLLIYNNYVIFCVEDKLLLLIVSAFNFANYAESFT
jgi:hypothetical protein